MQSSSQRARLTYQRPSLRVEFWNFRFSSVLHQRGCPGGTTMHANHRNQEASGDWPETILMFSALAAWAIIAFWVLNS
jgi:hypothetical protein